MERPKHAVPDDGELAAKVRRNDEIELPDRIDRYRFILGEFGPPADMLHGGGMQAALAMVELQRSFIHGNFLATVLTAQAYLERTMGASIAASGDDETAGSTFVRLIDAELGRGRLTQDLANRLHALRRLRNPYVHHREVLGDYTLERRMMDSEAPVWVVAEADARLAVEVIVDFLRHYNPNWRPGNEGESIFVM